MNAWVVLAAAAAASLGLTGLIRRYALRHGVIDVPNERSSHTEPMPRGGGMAIVITVVACVAVLHRQGSIPAAVSAALVGAGCWIALIGFLDDHIRIPAVWRFLAHCLGATWTVYCLATPDPVFALPLWLEWLLAGVYFVALVNVYNFMDGIDGIAALEAITVGLGAVLMYVVAMPGVSHWVAPALVLAATLGFLFWNFPHARIFMGDGCSGFFGAVFAALSIHASSVDSKYLWGWLVLLGVFIVDSAVTLFRRSLRHEPLHVAHRAHAYQYASRRFGSHAKVSSTVAIINAAWLCPIAVGIAAGVVPGPIGVVVAYVPLVALAFVFKAGASDRQGAHA